MGIEAFYRRLTPAEFDALMAAPPTFDPFVPNFEEMLAERGAGKDFWLGKDWHALHFLLTGDASLDAPSPAPPPLGDVVLGGTPTPMDTGMGPVRSLAPEQVRAVADALSAIPVEELRRRFDPAAFNARRIYPGLGGWNEEEREALLDEMYPELVEYFRRAAEAGDFVLISLG